MVRPHGHGKTGDGDGGENQALVAEERFAGEHRDDLGDDAEERDRDDVDLGVAEEPEQVLPQHRTAGGRVEHVRAEHPVGHRGEQGGGEQREDDDDHEGGDQDVPGEDRHSEHGHPGRAQSQDGGDHVDRAEDGAQTGQDQADVPQIAAHAGTVLRAGQGLVGEPTEVRGAAGGGEPADDHQAAEKIQPVGERIQPGERHIRCADLQRHHVVREGEHDRRGEQQQHDRAVHGEQLVVLLGGQKLHTRPGQFAAHQQGHEPAGEEEPERGDQVHDPDLLRVGGPQQPGERRTSPSAPDRSGVGRDSLRTHRRHVCTPSATGATRRTIPHTPVPGRERLATAAGGAGHHPYSGRPRTNTASPRPTR